jgi:hypothetical protein|tara:strand:+ start:594 stop:776 length:183 start_codon:yes stop_codon:yes gene_type:complete
MGRQIGNDEGNQVVFRKSIYGKSESKGARPRINIYSKQYQDNWDKIFKKGEKNAKEKDND